jgi:general secretion pathway protein K
MRAQRGAALLAAIATVAIVAGVAASMLYEQDLWLRQVEVARDSAQARIGLRAALAWAAGILHEDARSSRADHLREPWAAALPLTRFDAAEIGGHITDRQGLYNLANLRRDGAVDANELARLRRLLVRLDLPEGLAGALALRPLSDLSELAFLPGATAEMAARLAPYVTLLPKRTPINVNTAPLVVLELIGPDLGADQAASIVAERERAYFRDPADFRNRMTALGVKFDAEAVGTASEFFLAEATVHYGHAQLRGIALLAREPGAWPSVVWQRFE